MCIVFMNTFNTMFKSARQEVLSASPLLVLYHDLLTEGEMHFMKDKVVHQSIFQQIWKKEFLMSHQRLPQVSSQMNPATVQDLTNNAGKVVNRPIWQVCISFCSENIKSWFHTAGLSVIEWWCHSTITFNPGIESLNSMNNLLINVRINININQSWY